MLALCYKAGRSGAGSWLSPASSLPGGLGSPPFLRLLPGRIAHASLAVVCQENPSRRRIGGGFRLHLLHPLQRLPTARGRAHGHGKLPRGNRHPDRQQHPELAGRPHAPGGRPGLATGAARPARRGEYRKATGTARLQPQFRVGLSWRGGQRRLHHAPLRRHAGRLRPTYPRLVQGRAGGRPADRHRTLRRCRHRRADPRHVAAGAARRSTAGRRRRRHEAGDPDRDPQFPEVRRCRLRLPGQRRRQDPPPPRLRAGPEDPRRSLSQGCTEHRPRGPRGGTRRPQPVRFLHPGEGTARRDLVRRPGPRPRHRLFDAQRIPHFGDRRHADRGGRHHASPRHADPRTDATAHRHGPRHAGHRPGRGRPDQAPEGHQQR